MPDPVMGTIAAVGGTSLVSGLLGAKAQEKAAEAQVAGNIQAARLQQEAGRESIAELRRQYDITRGDILEERKYQRSGAIPYREAGEEALGQLRGVFAGDVDPTDALEKTPGYQFQLGQGQRALESSAAARGGLLSGRALQESQQLGQGLAQGTYRNYLGDLFKMAGYGPTVSGVGQGMTGQLAGLGQTTSRGIADTLTQGGLTQARLAAQSGQARASAYAADPWGQAFGSISELGAGYLGTQAYQRPR